MKNTIQSIFTFAACLICLYVFPQADLVSTGGANVFSLSFPGNMTAYQPGQSITFRSNQTITGPATISINGLGVATIVSTSGTALNANDIITGQEVTIVYDGSGRFQMTSSSGNGAAVAATNPWSYTSPNIYQTTLTDFVGIGTSAPAQKLHVYSSSGFTRLLIDALGSGTAGTEGSSLVLRGKSIFNSVEFTQDNSNNALKIRIGGLDRMYIDGANPGNVSIGTTSPLTKLDVRGANATASTATFENIFEVASTDAIPLSLRFGIKTDANGTSRYAAIEVDDNSVKRALSLQPAGGNVGIGTISPSQVLDVSGKFQVDNNGNIVKLNGVPVNFPSANIAGVLTNTGTGVLSWSPASTGTVTLFSSGSLAPLFTTAVATPATTPALSFTLSNAGAYSLFGNNTGASAAPAYFTPILSSALFQNQGSTTTLLHGNAAGNPTWTQIVNSDITNGTIDLTTKVTGVLPIANGGTGSNTQNFVDLTNTQTVAGAKSWSNLGTFNAGITSTGAIVNINTSSNFGTNINSGTSTGTVTIGGLFNSVALPKFTTAGIVTNTAGGILGTTATIPVTNGGTGTGTTFTQGSVVFAGASGTYNQNNAAFFWDNTNSRLGIGTATPSRKLHVYNSAADQVPLLVEGSDVAWSSIYINAINTTANANYGYLVGH